MAKFIHLRAISSYSLCYGAMPITQIINLCKKFKIPAAIGCGEQRFEELLTSNQILLDCAAGLINRSN